METYTEKDRAYLWCNEQATFCEFAGLTGDCRFADCKKQQYVLDDLHTRKLRAEMEAVPDQTAKRDAGKLRLTLVPREILRCIAKVREYGVKKYTDPENWRRVEVERYQDAAFRHLLAYLDDPQGVDTESGLPHLWHLATNVDFLCELEKGRWE